MLYQEAGTRRVSRFGPAVRPKTGKRTTSVPFPVSALLSLQKLWFCGSCLVTLSLTVNACRHNCNVTMPTVPYDVEDVLVMQRLAGR